MKLDLEVKCSKETVMKIMDCNESSQHYSLYEKYYYELINIAKEKLKPLAYIHKSKDKSNYIEKENYNYEILCFVTLGKEADAILEELYLGDDFLKAMFFDNITNQILFNASSELYKYLKTNYIENSLKLTTRKVPGERGVEFGTVKVIFDKMAGIIPPDIKLSSAYMISPLKSLLYYYGVGDFQEECEDISCMTCEKTDCKQKLVSNL